MMNKSTIANGMMIVMASILILLLIVDMANAKKDKEKEEKKKDEKDDKISSCYEQQWGTDQWRYKTCKKDDKQCVRMTCDGKDVRACYDDDDVCKDKKEQKEMKKFIEKHANGIDVAKCTNCRSCKGRDDKDGEYCNGALGGGTNNGWVTILAGLAMALWMAVAAQ